MFDANLDGDNIPVRMPDICTFVGPRVDTLPEIE